MSKRLGWVLGVAVLVAIGVLVACGSNYNSSSDGLMLVGSQGSGLVETFSFNLGSGSISAVSNTPADTSNKVCVLGGLPSSLVVDRAGAYAYAILTGNPLCNTTTPPFTSVSGILSFKVNSDGSTTQVGSLVLDPNPVAMVMDAAGKFLFVAEGTSSTPCVSTAPQSGVCAYAIGSGGSLTAVPGTFTFPLTAMVPNFVALATTPTVFPPIGINGVQNSVCSSPGLNPPTSEYLYLVDAQNYVVWEFGVSTSTGALGNPGLSTLVTSFGTDPVPAGVAVDPCDRFVYVSDSLTDRVSAFTICSVVTPTCPLADGSLVPVAGSPFVLSGSVNGPGPIVVDPYGNYVYVVGTLSNTISLLKISPISGSLTALSPPTVATGSRPTSITIRADDSWLFVTDYNAASVSQYAVTPATGSLTVLPGVQTDNYPWGVAVK